MRPEYLGVFSDKIRDTAFTDARGSAKDSSTLGLPSVEFAPYGRVPNTRGRKDARQGTIDQDQEFIEFLESLTNPITKPAPPDSENDVEGKKKDKVTVTPLIQYLRDKKANKGKESSVASKNVKHTREDFKDSKSSTSSDKKATIKAATPSPDKRSAQAIKVEKAARDAARVLNKQVASVNRAPVSPVVNQPAAPDTPSNDSVTPLAEKKRERGNASAAARILQRDLGLSTNSGGRRGRREASGPTVKSAPGNTQLSAKQEVGRSQLVKEPESDSLTNSVSTNKTQTTSFDPSTINLKSLTQPPTGPAATRSSTKAPPPNNANSHVTKTGITPKKPLTIPSTATQAFLKHANPSQGITEPLLEEAFASFGTINKVEIDKKKGFAYIDFAEPEGLQNSIKGSPVKVGQGQVVVLERKTGSTLQARNMRGGVSMLGSRGGAMAMGPRGGRGGLIRGGGLGRGSANLTSARGPNKSAATVAPPSPMGSSTVSPVNTTAQASTITEPITAGSLPAAPKFFEPVSAHVTSPAAPNIES